MLLGRYVRHLCYHLVLFICRVSQYSLLFFLDLLDGMLNLLRTTLDYRRRYTVYLFIDQRTLLRIYVSTAYYVVLLLLLMMMYYGSGQNVASRQEFEVRVYRFSVFLANTVVIARRLRTRYLIVLHLEDGLAVKPNKRSNQRTERYLYRRQVYLTLVLDLFLFRYRLLVRIYRRVFTLGRIGNHEVITWYLLRSILSFVGNLD